ncbi:MAG: cytochrome c-type biogenesis protein, partial [Gemmatimonadales bacterium]
MTAVRRSGGAAVCDRREFLGVLAGGLLLTAHPPIRPSAQDSLAGSGPAGKVWDPARAGRPLTPITAADNDAAIQAIEKRLRCTCGCGLDIYTCRTTDFNCTYSPTLHRQVVALADAGKTAQEILDAFVAQYGVEMLMAPPKRGFNLAGYFAPSLAVLVAAAFLIRTLRRWTRAAAADAAATLPLDPRS